MEDFDFRAIVLIIFLVISALKWLGQRMKGKATDQPLEDQSDNQREKPSTNSLDDIYQQYREQISNRQKTITQEPGNQESAVRSSPPPMTQAATVIEEPVIKKSLVPPKTVLTKAQKAAAQKFEQLSKKDKRKQKNNDNHASLRDLLTSPGSAKQAVILTEILGKPKSMQKSSYGY